MALLVIEWGQLLLVDPGEEDALTRSQGQVVTQGHQLPRFPLLAS